MPVITLEAGTMDQAQKEELIQKLTQVASEELNINEEAIVVLLKENNPENIGSGGKVLSKLIAERTKK